MAFLIAVVALHHSRRFELGEGEGLDELLQRHAVLQTDRDRDGEIVHHRPEARAFLVHVDEDLTQRTVLRIRRCAGKPCARRRSAFWV